MSITTLAEADKILRRAYYGVEVIPLDERDSARCGTGTQAHPCPSPAVRWLGRFFGRCAHCRHHYLGIARHFETARKMRKGSEG